MQKLNLAIIGQGRSGRDIHGKFLISQANDIFNVKYVVERDARRRELAKERYAGCEVLDDYKLLFDKQVDLVVNASFSDEHYAVTKDLLVHSKNVLCEKPFARTVKECQDLIDTAKEKGVLLAVFQQTFFAPFVGFAYNILRVENLVILNK